jgi:hypothetical protein
MAIEGQLKKYPDFRGFGIPFPLCESRLSAPITSSRCKLNFLLHRQAQRGTLKENHLIYSQGYDG